MRIPPWALLSGGLVLIAALIAVAIFAAGGDDDPAAATGTVTPTPPADDDFGAPPTMTDHIHAVSPAHAGKIQRAQTVEAPRGATGICAEVSYQDLPQNNLMFQMAFDDAIVTDKTTVSITEGTFEAPIRGLLCYATPEGFALGLHSAAVAVQDPNNLTGPPSELVGWKFEVIE